MLLAIDTSAGSSVALLSAEGDTLAECAVTDTMRHAEVIGTLIRDCLEAAGARAGQVTHVAAGMGPGPFTGLRVGIAAARAFAIGAGARLLPVVSHDAIALEHYRSGGTGGLLVVTDARRRELYCSAYAGLDMHGVPERTHGPSIAKPDALGHEELFRLDAGGPSAAALGGLALLLERNGLPLAGSEPLYLRSPDVTLSAGPKRVTA